MLSWIMKSMLQGAMSLTPFPRELNYVFQRHISKKLRPERTYFQNKLSICIQHLDAYEHYTSSQQKLPRTLLELGTGWLPIIPIGFSLCGVTKIISVDQVNLLKPHLIRETIEFFIQLKHQDLLHQFLPRLDDTRLALLDQANAAQDAATALEILGIQTVVADARTYQSDAVDFFTSTSTLEHIPAEIIRDILINFHKLANPSSVMSHVIDLSDHYFQVDKTITPLNFLKFPERQWRFFNNSLQYQNRLRISDYRALHSEAGFRVVYEDSHSYLQPHKSRIKIAQQFEHYSPEDLLVIESHLVSTPK